MGEKSVPVTPPANSGQALPNADSEKP